MQVEFHFLKLRIFQKILLQDHASLSDNDTLYAPNSTKFINQDPIHLLDICSGKIEHLNLKNIVRNFA
jgi:hypothetical protein